MRLVGKLITWVGIAGLLVFCAFAYERLENSDGVRYRAEIEKLEADVAEGNDVVAERDATISAMRSGISRLREDVECRIEEDGDAATDLEEIRSFLADYFKPEADAEEEGQ